MVALPMATFTVQRATLTADRLLSRICASRRHALCDLRGSKRSLTGVDEAEVLGPNACKLRFALSTVRGPGFDRGSLDAIVQTRIVHCSRVTCQCYRSQMSRWRVPRAGYG